MQYISEALSTDTSHVCKSLRGKRGGMQNKAERQHGLIDYADRYEQEGVICR